MLFDLPIDIVEEVAFVDAIAAATLAVALLATAAAAAAVSLSLSSSSFVLLALLLLLALSGAASSAAVSLDRRSKSRVTRPSNANHVIEIRGDFATTTAAADAVTTAGMSIGGTSGVSTMVLLLLLESLVVVAPLPMLLPTLMVLDFESDGAARLGSERNTSTSLNDADFSSVSEWEVGSGAASLVVVVATFDIEFDSDDGAVTLVDIAAALGAVGAAVGGALDGGVGATPPELATLL